MPAAASPKAQQRALAHRRKICAELVRLHVRHAAVFERIEALKAELKTIATDLGDSFREVIAGKGQVTVAPPKDGAFKGNVPALQVEAWNGLKEAAQNKLLDQGLVKIEAEYGGKFYGRVDVKTFAGAAS